MTAPPKKPGWAFWTAGVLIAASLLYVLSIGPVAACLIGREDMTDAFLSAYRPLNWAMSASETVQSAVNWYLRLWTNGVAQIT